MEQFIQSLSELNPLVVYAIVAGIAYTENVFPPFPSDVVVVAAGSLVPLGHVDFFATLVVATVGSTAGFMTMYKIGDWFGDKILETGKVKFIPIDQVHKVESWFKVHGYWIIVANRFLAGTRAVVSFFAGLSELPLSKTTLLSFVSSLAWNFILLLAGRKLGENWRVIGFYLELYGKTVTGLLVIGILLYIAFRVYKKNQRINADTPSSPNE